MSAPRVLVAGIGNVFMGDDGFGVEVSRRLASRALPEGVRVVDFGIRSVDLVYALLDGYDAAILVDAAPRGGPPGTLYVIEPDAPPPADAASVAQLAMHGMELSRVLAAARAMGATWGALRVVACEPGRLGAGGDDDGGGGDVVMGLSDAVAAAVDPAADLVVSLARELRGEASAGSAEGRA